MEPGSSSEAEGLKGVEGKKGSFLKVQFIKAINIS
jgi:hypothetical protein